MDSEQATSESQVDNPAGSPQALSMADFRGTLHDLANVFATILGYAELALSKDAGEPVRRYLEELHRAGQRGDGLVRAAQEAIHRAQRGD